MPTSRRALAPAITAALVFGASSNVLAAPPPPPAPVAAPAPTPTPVEPAPVPEPVAPEAPESSEVETSAAVDVSPTSVAADDDGIMKGRLGVGAVHTLAGINGINVRFFVAERFHIGVNVGMGLFTHKIADPNDDPMDPECDPDEDCKYTHKRTVTLFGASAEAMYWVPGRPAGNLPLRANFGVGGRFGFLHHVNATDIAHNQDDDLQLHVEIPLMIALMLGENFALVPEFRAVFRIIPGSRAPRSDGNSDSNPGFGEGSRWGTTNGPGFGFEISPGFGLFGGAALMYMF